MKQSGITRRIDELGRIVIPKEIRKNLGIRDGESLEIYVEDSIIYLKKHFQMHNQEDISKKICNIINSVLDIDIIITDREKVIATNEKLIEINNKIIDKKLIKLIDNRESYQSVDNEIMSFEDKKINSSFLVMPIISSIDSIGLVIILNKNLGFELLIAKIVAKILSEKIDIC